jgi:IS5 family transposase
MLGSCGGTLEIFRRNAVRLAYHEQPRLDCPDVSQVQLNLQCRDEIIPILRALQHVYENVPLRAEILELVGEDVNQGCSRHHGRPGMAYWSILVLAAVRLGCNLDYDKLQDLAEQHHKLRLMMGIGDWQEQVDFDWRRIRDNLSLLRPETLEKINQVVVGAGHALAPEAIKKVRGDTFVVETNVHYPTESSLIADGLRKVITLAVTLAALYGQPGWRQSNHVLKNLKALVRQIGRTSRAKGLGADRLKPGYEKLLGLAEDLMGRAHALLATVTFAVTPPSPRSDELQRDLLHYLRLTAQVCGTAKRRVLLGETVPNADKLFSIYEPHTELIKRGKQPNPIQYGHMVLVIEDAVGFICHYEVVANGVLDQDLLVPVMTKLQARFAGQIERASFDRGFHTPANQKQLAEIVAHPCLPKKGQALGRKQQEDATVEFRQARENHPGVESAIGALQAGNGQARCRDKSKEGYDRYVGLGILGRNLQVLGKLLLAQDDAASAAAKTNRKKAAG